MSLKTQKRLLVVATLLILIFLFTACEENNDFRGGELLDSEKMSEIKSEIIGDLVTSEGETDSDINFNDTENDIGSDETFSNNVDGDVTEKTDSAAQNGNDSQNTEKIIVYWTKSGKVWHLSENCRYIKNSEQISGTVEEAIEAGKERVCSSCGK